MLALNSVIGGTQEWRAEINTAALRSSIQSVSRVLRDRTVTLVDSAGLVPGDMILLEAAYRVLADIRLLSAFDLRADEPALTGESLPVDKAANQPVSPNAPIGDRALAGPADHSPLTRRLERISRNLGIAMSASS